MFDAVPDKFSFETMLLLLPFGLGAARPLRALGPTVCRLISYVYCGTFETGLISAYGLLAAFLISTGC